MRIWREIEAGLRSLLRRGEVERDVDDELRHFMEEAEADLVSRGSRPEEARRAVRLRYGDPLTAREDVRAAGWWATVDTLFADLRLGARTLRRSPGFTAVVVLTLGLGVGAATAIFSAVWPVLFEPLAYPGAERIVTVADRGEGGIALPATFGTYRELVERSRAFEAIAALKRWQPTLTGGDEPQRLEGQSVSASYFDVLGVRPAIGPGLDPAEDRTGGAAEVVLRDDFWRERFGADRDVIGRLVELDGEPTAVVGVMPPGFEDVISPQARVWSQLRYDPLAAGFDTREWGRHLEIVGRVRSGLAPDDAGRELDQIAREPVAAMPRPSWVSLERGFAVQPLKDAVTADVKPTMLVLLGAVVLLISVTCANLTILLLARGARRRPEFAMRTALGAGRGRLARYLVTEGLLLAALGGALGVAVARLGLAALVSAAPPSLPRVAALEVDTPALLLALVVTTVVGVVFGLAPGLHRSGGGPAIREAGRGLVQRSRATRSLMVIAEVALATVLLVGSGLLLRSATRLFAQPLGLEPSGVVVMQIFGTGLEHGDAVTHRFFDEALAAVRAVPGVTAAAMTSQLPLSGDSEAYGVVPDVATSVPGTVGPAERFGVTPGYLETMRVPLVTGRTLEADDAPGAPRVAVVSRSLAERLFPDGDPLGRGIRVGAEELDGYTVVGVVEDVKHASLAEGPAPAVYVTTSQWHWADRVRWLVVRAEGDATGLVPALRSAIWSVDGDQPVVRAQSMESLVARSEARRRFVLLILSAFAMSALAVSGVGLFGVLSGAVAERMREMGVRAALGASRERIVSMVVRQGLGLTVVGTLLGVVGAVAASGALGTMLFEVSRLDAITYAVTIAVLLGGAAAASAVPAVRAGRADPVDALRSE